MLSDEDCRSRAEHFLAEVAHRCGEELLLIPSAVGTSTTVVYCYQTTDYVATGDFAHALAGNGPILVNRLTGTVEIAGTALPIGDYIREFEARAGSILKSSCMKEEALEIRPLTAFDAPAFRQIRLLAISDSPSAVWPTMEEEAGRTDKEIEARILRTDSQIVFGAFIDKALVGVAGLRRESLLQVRHKAVLWGLFVSPDWRRAGLAQRLWAQVECFARAEGVLQIQLCVNTENIRARCLYRSLGFESFGLEPRAMRIGDKYFAEEHMVLRLDD